MNNRDKSNFWVRATGSIALPLLAAAFTFSSAPRAEEAQPLGPKLTPKLQQLLADEMRAVKQAMEHIMNGLLTGDHSLVANMSQQIHDSFILQRELTEEDKNHLMSAASPGFLKLDGAFHKMAGMLSQVAREKHTELETYYFGRMVEACTECHSQYATNKFPLFSGKLPEGHSH